MTFDLEINLNKIPSYLFVPAIGPLGDIQASSMPRRIDVGQRVAISITDTRDCPL